MTKQNEKKKEYLQQTWWIQKRIKEIENRIRQMEIDWQNPPSINSDGMPHGSSLSDLSDYYKAREQLEEQLQKEHTRLLVEQERTFSEIKKLPHKYALILEKRYLSRLSFSKIGEELGYEKSTIYDMHGKALELFEISDKKDR